MQTQSPIKELKKALRLEALARRDALPADYRSNASLQIAGHGISAISFAPGEIISGFWPIRSEVDLRPLLFALRDRGARLCLPVIIDKQTIVFRELLQDMPMIETGFGTSGPHEDAPVVDPTFMLVPLAAFDERGHRIGYGAGYYDRAIARLQNLDINPRLIGTAFDCQKVEIVPDEPHDVPLEAILTESGLHSFGSIDKAN
ncbi:5-formyltetrahydrofolate cyclo-ligase [Phyllobacterium sp. YR531]|uniref:5-formyltetrahydrofolate cyclo-ligase n=1 Tax=Phyllobacterium sp. YR531 TaxID=1144343 RepID=UPI0005949A5D|nr:5-formyltetrahydrofolate cyclo-ligase [Phyllobacterium sp. YR531]